MEGEPPRLPAGAEIEDPDGAVPPRGDETLTVGAEGHAEPGGVEAAERLALPGPGGGVHEEDLGAQSGGDGGPIGTPGSGGAGDDTEQRPATYVPEVAGSVGLDDSDEEPPAVAAGHHQERKIRWRLERHLEAEQLDGPGP